MSLYIVRNNFNGTTGSPPNLTGQAGSMIGVLDHCLVTTCGWTKVYSGTNLAAYRAPTGNRAYLYVDDTNATTARVAGFESMTSISAGVNRFPSESQVSGGLYWPKSSTADATARSYMFISDGKLFYLASVPTGAATTAMTTWAFGDFISMKSGADPWCVMIQGQLNATLSTSALNTDYFEVSADFASSGCYVMRPYTGIGGSIAAARWIDARYGSSNASQCVFGAGPVPFPAPIQGGLVVSPIWLAEQVGSSASIGDVRGRLPGWWNPCHTRPLANADTFVGPSGSLLAGRTIEAVTTANGGQQFFEISDTWN